MNKDNNSSGGGLAIGDADMQRAVACVNFCQHIPADLLARLAAERIGAATFIQWVRRNPVFHVTEGECGEWNVCPHCDHVLGGPEGGHQEGCLMEKALEMIGESL